MSYILDALRRADSERERGAVPGVHAQALPPGPADLDGPPPARHWLVVSIVLGVLLVAALAWQFFAASRAPDAAPVAALTPRPVTDPPAEAPAVAAVAEPASVPAPAPVPKKAPAVPPVARAVPKAAAPAPSRPTAATPVARPVAAAREAAPAAPPAPPPPVRIPMSNELPDELQRAVPALQIGGASYSQNADSRMLIVNGQVMREGDKLSAEVTLEQIRLKEAVLSVRGTRFRIAY